MSQLTSINLQGYVYDLPDERIAKYPLEERDLSKLLHYHQGQIDHRGFKDIVDLIPEGSTLAFNNTKVIPARMIFYKDTGAQIEIFLLKPVAPSNILSLVMEERAEVQWQCMIGNFKKWKSGQVLRRTLEDGDKGVEVKVEVTEEASKTVRFSWLNPDYSFAEIVELAGKVPLPPYLNREPEAEDKPRYQTVYSEKEGAVAAPTAGLHFTPEILGRLKDKEVKETFFTLHVSAGTFQPIKTENVIEHPMHSEQLVIPVRSIEEIVEAKDNVIAVGTTSMRTLESLYWFGIRLLSGNEVFAIDKLEPYEQTGALPGRKAAFQAILDWMSNHDLNQIIGSTEIFIFPGYTFRVCNGLITNFHQPGSTLMLLVAALIGEDWKEVYRQALENNYRFLSYGDSSLLLPDS
ncbi:MAG: S-adenosylmethionine:tRNA ribosyltransferase-isomerase [Roseivirga sp.]|nr:S-adenosylmethionine:tRNA ribosyltransferase-isomerase [Roseivirga sp.]